MIPNANDSATTLNAMVFDRVFRRIKNFSPDATALKFVLEHRFERARDKVLGVEECYALTLLAVGAYFQNGGVLVFDPAALLRWLHVFKAYDRVLLALYLAANDRGACADFAAISLISPDILSGNVFGEALPTHRLRTWESLRHQKHSAQSIDLAIYPWRWRVTRAGP